MTKQLLILGLLSLSIFSCAPATNFPAIDEVQDTEGAAADPSEVDEVLAFKKTAQLTTDMNLRTLKSGILEFVVELPLGSKIEVSDNYQVYLNDFRNSDGSLGRSSTGFISPIKIVEVPAAYRSQFTAQVIKNYNSTATGLFISSSALISGESAGGNFAIVKASADGAGYLSFYNSSGKPKFNFVNSITKRFGARLNRAVTPATSAEKNKWTAIYNELKKVANRTVATPKSYLIMDKSKAEAAFTSFERDYVIPTSGAWTMATEWTAVKHGFPNVPCAEFQSEILREAFKRSGYNVLNDFNTQKGNYLFWTNTASVKNFSNALFTAGWVPWTTDKYRPVIGAYMFHGAGLSPGHTYLAAGDDARIIMDNGSPQGRDLRKTTKSSIEIQYQPGLFFLPPGINPQPW